MSVSYLSSKTSYVICWIIAVAFSLLINFPAWIINSSGLSLNWLNTVGWIPVRIWMTAFRVSPVSSTNFPTRSYLTLEFVATLCSSYVPDFCFSNDEPSNNASFDLISFMDPVSTLKNIFGTRSLLSRATIDFRTNSSVSKSTTYAVLALILLHNALNSGIASLSGSTLSSTLLLLAFSGFIFVSS